MESLVNIPTNEDTLIVKACCLLRTLVYKQKITLPSKVAVLQVKWLLQCLERCFYEVVCEVLSTLAILLKQCAENIDMFTDTLVSHNGVLINLLIDPDYRRVDRNSVYDSCSPGEIYLAVLLCLETFLNASEESRTMEKYFTTIGDSILSLVFRLKNDILPETSFYTLMITAFNCLRLVSLQQEDWLENHIGQLMGISKSYMMYGIPNVNQLTPHKIMVSQQGVPEPQHIPINKGGKVPKTRKTRTPVKGKGTRVDGRKGANKSGSTWDENSRQPYSEQSFMLDGELNS